MDTAMRLPAALAGLALTVLLAGCQTHRSGAAKAGEGAVAATVYLVRHAEKERSGDDPALTAQGRDRANALADRLAAAGVTDIWSTDTRRTLDTAEPLAVRLGLDVRLYDPRRPEALAGFLAVAGGTALVVGHSNTVPALVAALGGEPGEPIEEAGEYDRLYVVRVLEGGRAETVTERYGN